MIVQDVCISLTPTEVARLERPIRGRGGFQNLLRYLARRLAAADIYADGGATIYVPDGVWTERLYRYRAKYGRGGFQARLVQR